MKKIQKIALVTAVCSLTFCVGLVAACSNDNDNKKPLIYTYNQQNDCYLVKATNTDISGEIEIPSEYNGKKVNISASAFYDCKNLESVSIGENVEIIGSNAFQNCTKLASITIPKGITSIGKLAFSNCTSLAVINYNAENCVNSSSNNKIFTNAGNDGNGITVNIGQNVTQIPSNFFASGKIVSVNFKEHSLCENIGNDAFYGRNFITNITLPDSLITIGSNAFTGCTALTSVVMGTNVTSIGADAFTHYNSDALTRVYYKGGKDDWNQISISLTTTIVRYYFSQDPPTESGYYWHYDNSENIEIWSTT